MKIKSIAQPNQMDMNQGWEEDDKVKDIDSIHGFSKTMLILSCGPK